MDREAVLEHLKDNVAIQALSSVDAGIITDAKFEHDELTLTVARENIRRTCEIVRTAGYNAFSSCTAVDWYPSEPRFQVTYHLLSHRLKQRLRLVVLLSGNDPVVDTVTTLWGGASFYEREVWDLMGIRFAGHPDLRRIMLPEEWEGHPLQKTYPVEGYR